jgi:pyruvate formate lyase activating enzyme
LTSGTIFNIQRFSLHDGPGIRTTVFFKGCPLRCAWCHNPESQNPYPELFFKERNCIGCRRCLECPRGAIEWKGGVLIKRELCDACGRCATVCPSEALAMVGEKITVDEVMREVLRDRVFYERSGGGITLSGGEPFFQPQFLEELLTAARSGGIHTAVETCGYTDWRGIEGVSGLVDHFLYDLKTPDPQKHLRITGASNEKIVSNLEKLLELGKEVTIRIPVVPPHNLADSKDANDLVSFLLQLRRREDFEVDLLPYNELTPLKYGWLGREYPLRVKDPRPLVRELKEKLVGSGFRVSIGGLR